MKLLGTKHWWVSRPRVKYNPKSIQGMVAWMVFCINWYVYRNGDRLYRNYYNLGNTFNSNYWVACPCNSLHFFRLLAGVFF
jgi:hypothetical protein